ncbi:unnamed protein product [Psylliodes chrysocephalus]|uniref:Uncharacterized protein n=1 Tax=Psylliodes chrysocephalus TaxID=3402493 RepID=A0A9P0CQT0_9CUCU|nr:unnamed protein product [Psylliodes chrysocephala]
MSFKQPEQFNPGEYCAQSWEKWRQSFELFMDAEDLNSKPVRRQRSTLPYVLGPIGLELYNTFVFVDEEGEKLAGDAISVEIILDSFSQHYKPFKNVTYARYKLFSEKQKVDQTIDEFVTILKVLAKEWELGALTEDLMTHCIIVGVLDEKLKSRLPNLDQIK